MGTTGNTFGRLAGTALARAGVVLAGFTVTVTVTGAAWGAQDLALSVGRPEGGDLVSIEGSISGVQAGAPSAPLRLTLRNPGDLAKTITKVRADSTGVVSGPARCTGDFLTVGVWTGSVGVPAHGEAQITLPVAVSAELPTECHDVAWGLVYTAY